MTVTGTDIRWAKLADVDPELWASFDHSPLIGLANPLSPPMILTVSRRASSDTARRSRIFWRFPAAASVARCSIWVSSVAESNLSEQPPSHGFSPALNSLDSP